MSAHAYFPLPPFHSCSCGILIHHEKRLFSPTVWPVRESLQICGHSAFDTCPRAMASLCIPHHMAFCMFPLLPLHTTTFLYSRQNKTKRAWPDRHVRGRGQAGNSSMWRKDVHGSVTKQKTLPISIYNSHHYQLQHSLLLRQNMPGAYPGANKLFYKTGRTRTSVAVLGDMVKIGKFSALPPLFPSAPVEDDRRAQLSSSVGMGGDTGTLS